MSKSIYKASLYRYYFLYAVELIVRYLTKVINKDVGFLTFNLIYILSNYIIYYVPIIILVVPIANTYFITSIYNYISSILLLVKKTSLTKPFSRRNYNLLYFIYLTLITPILKSYYNYNILFYPSNRLFILTLIITLINTFYYYKAYLINTSTTLYKKRKLSLTYYFYYYTRIRGIYPLICYYISTLSRYKGIKLLKTISPLAIKKKLNKEEEKYISNNTLRSLVKGINKKEASIEIVVILVKKDISRNKLLSIKKKDIERDIEKDIERNNRYRRRKVSLRTRIYYKLLEEYSIFYY
ncbi:hypothetical protein P153DRAFT_359640 [Dothidotthia symphoricarpi CBS 119687]|uniref:Uncharacterized protein n=1 Tax=Dothidotthia symphoricarpi CBS 119687 TaxID=1392245 RepID=A0A6A6A335_9PLEO|nr:uncharacterized protein P153DRAFT_359640 [Dothidotthia symphoricarpi CBS 119687]KAF2125956.1 hypothetical protein P153DRAFT_359640 [Dothidotthia symphoricarpi CBS 119687]